MAWREVVGLLLLSGVAACSFLIDFPDGAEGPLTDDGTGGNGGFGASVHLGGTGGVGAGPDGGHGGEGGSEGGGSPTCVLDGDAFASKFDWAHPLASASLDGNKPVALALESDGDTWLGGHVSGGMLNAGGTTVVSTTGGGEGIFLIELDPTGKSKRGYIFGTTGVAKIFDMVFLPNGQLAFVGSFSNPLDFGDQTITPTPPNDPENDFDKLDGYIAIFDPQSGSVIRSRAFGDGEYQEMTSIGTNGSGALYVAASGEGMIDWGNGPVENDGIFLAKITDTFEFGWSRQLDTGLISDPEVAVAADGSVVVTGGTSQSYVFGGTQPGEAVVDYYDAFVARYDTNGKWLWHRIFGAGSIQYGTTVTVGPNGDIFATGVFVDALHEHGGTTMRFTTGEPDYGTDDVYLARLERDSGDTLWIKQIGGSSYQRSRGLKVDCADRVIMVGTAHSPEGTGVDFGDNDPVPASFIDSYQDLFLAVYRGNDGSLLHKVRKGDQYEEIPRQLELDHEGRAVFAGSYYESMVLDRAVGGTLQAPQWDFFVTRFDTHP